MNHHQMMPSKTIFQKPNRLKQGRSAYFALSKAVRNKTSGFSSLKHTFFKKIDACIDALGSE